MKKVGYDDGSTSNVYLGLKPVSYFQMNDCPVLEDIINCFTSIDQLLTFAHAYGMNDDPYVISR